MKKASIFFIIIICIVSVVVISLFGQSIETGQFKTYMTSIEITNETLTIPGSNQRYLMIDFNDLEGYSTVTIEYTYTPDDADYPDAVRFSLSNNTYTDEEGNLVETYAEVNSYGVVVFYKPKTVTVTVTTTDGSQLSDSIMIMCL